MIKSGNKFSNSSSSSSSGSRSRSSSSSSSSSKSSSSSNKSNLNFGKNGKTTNKINSRNNIEENKYYIYIENLSPNVNNSHIEEIFSAFGKVKKILNNLKKKSENTKQNNRQIYTGRRNIHSLVNFNSKEEAEIAVKCMNGGQVDGNKIRVELVKLSDREVMRYMENVKMEIILRDKKEKEEKSINNKNRNVRNRIKSRSRSRSRSYSRRQYKNRNRRSIKRSSKRSSLRSSSLESSSFASSSSRSSSSSS